MCVLSIKVSIRKKYGNLFNDPRILVCNFASLSFEILIQFLFHPFSFCSCYFVLYYVGIVLQAAEIDLSLSFLIHSTSPSLDAFTQLPTLLSTLPPFIEAYNLCMSSLRCNGLVHSHQFPCPLVHLSEFITPFTNTCARTGYDTRSIFERSLTGLNYEFSFS